jgi:hypothetical protein
LSDLSDDRFADLTAVNDWLARTAGADWLSPATSDCLGAIRAAEGWVAQELVQPAAITTWAAMLSSNADE